MATFETYELGAESELRVEIPTTAELTVRLLLLTVCPLFRFFLFFFPKKYIGRASAPDVVRLKCWDACSVKHVRT